MDRDRRSCPAPDAGGCLDQSPTETPKPYPWSIAMRGKNPAVLDVELLNPFNGIDATRNERQFQFENGEFGSFNGPGPTMFEVAQTHSGALRFVNCAFWGRCNQIARVAGKGTVGFSPATRFRCPY
jgi:hypothetical protein